ncbi:MAG: hypothetical protein JNL79_00435 [Myxococcales bacterium]|nr:hypothetical protein [Myxococcales bacterium]
MSADLYRCGTCGASLSLEQLRGTDCPFCKQAFPHHARAVEQAQLVNQVMAQQIHAQNPWMQPPQVPGQYGAPMQPPQAYGAPPGAYGGPPAGYGANFNPNAYNVYGAQVNQAVKRSMTMVFVIVGLSFVLGIGGVVAALLLH